MAKKRKKKLTRTFVKEWRHHRGLTQIQLSERVGIAQGSLSDLERGTYAYTQPVLEALAEALGTTPASLIMRDPTQPGSIWDLLEQIPAADRQSAAKALEGFTKKTGTDG